MTSPFHVRPFKFPEDIPALVGLKNAYFAAHHIERGTNSDKQRQLMSYPGHTPKQDNFVATSVDNEDELLGHMWVWQQTPERTVFDLHIHPNWQRKGIGSELLQWAIQRSREHGSDYLDCQISVECAPFIRFVQKHNLKPLGTYLHMTLSPSVSLPDVKLPEGFTIRPYSEIQDITLYTEVMNRSYGDFWGHMVDVSEEFVAGSLDYYKPECIYLLMKYPDHVAGVGRIICDRNKGAFIVDAPGVIPAHRSPELYRALLNHSINALRERMHEPISIQMDSWGDLDSTVALFWELSFTVVRHAIGYRYYL